MHAIRKPNEIYSMTHQNHSDGHDSTEAAALNGVFNELIEPLQRAVAKSGYTDPTPIQEQTIPHLLKNRDLIGCAQTGTGKTAAFTLPILQNLLHRHSRPVAGLPRALILAPTRELAAQIGDSVANYGRFVKISHTVIFGGVKQHSQVNALQQGRDILVATPGRLLDLMQQGHISLNSVEIFVLDEADRMLDMGFLPDIRKVIERLPKRRQTLFYSATMVGEVMKLANTLVHDAIYVTIAPEQPAVERIQQKLYFVDKRSKLNLLLSLLKDTEVDKVIIFSRTKHGANRIAQKLTRANVRASAIHGDKSQGARTRALAQFKQGDISVLVATDIAARGIDIDNISHVINYDLPNESETYVHRIGRTARAGAEGDAISFCSADERDYLRSIERLIRSEIPVELNHDHHSDAAQYATGADAKPAPRVQRPSRQSHRNQGGKPQPGRRPQGQSGQRRSGSGSGSGRSRRSGRPQR
jgi:ATP-dependent RNA helicase RhlE